MDRDVNLRRSSVVSIAEAPAKVIIVGEHFCVYDAPAVAMAINMHARVEVKESSTQGIHVTSRNLGITTHYPPASSAANEATEPSNQTLAPVRLAVEAAASSLGMRELRLDVTVDSRIPVGVGLGSSASVAVAALTATACFFGVNLSKQDIFKMAYASEGMVHGRPSGIDQAACTHGGFILYRMSTGARSIAAAKTLHLVVGNTGIIRSTGAVVGKLRKMYEEDKRRVEPMIAAGGGIAEEAARAIREGNLEELGMLMNRNQTLLQEVGVSHARLEEFIRAALKAGALGAKLTGGGGGGCMIALASNTDEASAVAEAIRQLGGDAFTVEADARGVHAWTMG